MNPKRVLTKVSVPCGNFGCDNEFKDLILCVRDVLVAPRSRQYVVLDLLGQGTFGQVFRCQDRQTKQFVAIKVIKNHPSFYRQATVEVQVLQMLNKDYDPEDHRHIVRILECFNYRSHLCIVFELLSMNLYELLSQNHFSGLHLSVVRGFLKQILDALCLLKDADVIHCDLKPENISLAGGNQIITVSEGGDSTETRHVPLIKLIDFGSACYENNTVYSYIQSRFYRSPEVLLGLPYDGSMDIWSLGCVAAEVFLGLPLFPGASDHDQLKVITEMLGDPPDHMLSRSRTADKFYIKSHRFIHGPDGIKRQVTNYLLKTPEEYARDTNTTVEQSKKYFKHSKLDDIIKAYPTRRSETEREIERRIAFTHFIRGLLRLDPQKRWTPSQAAAHPFITGEPFDPAFVPPAPRAPVSQSKPWDIPGTSTAAAAPVSYAAHSYPFYADPMVQFPSPPMHPPIPTYTHGSSVPVPSHHIEAYQQYDTTGHHQFQMQYMAYGQYSPATVYGGGFQPPISPMQQQQQQQQQQHHSPYRAEWDPFFADESTGSSPHCFGSSSYHGNTSHGKRNKTPDSKQRRRRRGGKRRGPKRRDEEEMRSLVNEFSCIEVKKH